MATIGVLTYTFPAGLKLKNTSFNKITFGGISESNGINNNNNNNNNNTIVTKIPDVGMIGSEVLVMRKKQKLVPLLNSNAKNIQQQPPAKKIKLSENIVNNNSATVKLGVPPPTSGKKTTPLPQAVARRNARERNRVKQVNNGFAALRQHIPEEIAEAFEAAGNGRGTAKKLSKVETLRMAVEYIRSLERLLELDVTKSNFSEGETSPTKTVIKTEMNSITALDEQYAESNYDSEENVSYINDTLPDITTVNGQQYIRIPGTNTYQLITTEIFENEENIQPISANNFTDDIALGTHLGGGYTLTTNSEDVSPTMAPASLSTDRYSSENQPSLSPADHLQQNHQHLLSQLQMHQEQHVHIKCEDTAVIYQSQLAPSSPPISEGQGFADIQLYDHGISSSTLKREIKQEIILETAALSEESMMEAIDWWDAHTPQSDDSVIL